MSYRKGNDMSLNMGTTRSFLSLLIVFTLIGLMLASCGNEADTGVNDADTSETSADANVQDEATPEPTADTSEEDATPQPDEAAEETTPEPTADTSEEDATPQPDEATSQEDEDWVQVSSIIESPEEYVGQTLTVRGDVNEIIEEGFSFTVSDETLLGLDALLIIGADREIAASDEQLFTVDGENNTTVEVAGTLYDFEEWTNTAAEEQLEADLYVDHSARPVLIADSVTIVSDQDNESQAETDTTEEDSTGTEDIVPLSDIANNPEDYVGQAVTTRGDFTDAVEPGYSFTLNDPALLGLDSLLVVGADDTVVPEDEAVFTPDDEEANANIEVTGTIYMFSDWATRENENLLNDDAYIEYVERPVLVADSVTTLTDEEANTQPATGSTDENADTQPATGSTDENAEATFVEFSEIVDNPEEYVGQTVTTRGDFTAIVEPGYSFVLNDPALLGLDSLLVIGVDDIVVPEDEAFFTPDEDEAKANIEVIGTVYILDADLALEDENVLADDFYLEYIDRPMLVADSVTTIFDE